MDQIPSSTYPDNRLIINEGELKLQRLAAIVVAIEVLPYYLCCSRAESKELSKKYRVHWWLRSHGWKIAEELFAPKIIQDLVSDPMDLITTEIDTWMDYHIPQVFAEYDHKRYRFVLKFIRHFVWTQFGTIDYVRTAEKWIAISADLKITLKQKYRLARLNCLVDAFENLYREYPALAIVEKRLPLVTYWSFRVADYDFNRSSRFAYADFDMDDADVKSTIPPYVPIWTYLLEQMDEAQRYSFSIGRMLEFPARVVKELLSKFTEIEQRRLFTERLHEIMKLFVAESCPQFAIQLWRYINDTINAEMYNNVFEELRCIDQYFGDDLTPHWLGDLEMEMWRCAPASLKESMLKYQNGYFLREWTFWFNNELHYKDLRNDTFLLEMLSDTSPKYRKEFWMANWDMLVIECKSKYFSKLIEVCLPEPGDADEFLEKVVNSSKLRKHLKNLSDNLKYSEFNQFLDQFVRDTKLKADLKKRFVPSENYLSERLKFQSMSHKNLEALSILLVDVYGSEISVEYKANFIRSEFIRCISDRDLWTGWRYSYNTNEEKPLGLSKHQCVVRGAEHLCDEQQLQIVKKKLLAEREFFDALAKEKKNMIVWDDLLKWLVGGRQAMEEESSLLDHYRSRSPISRCVGFNDSVECHFIIM